MNLMTDSPKDTETDTASSQPCNAERPMQANGMGMALDRVMTAPSFKTQVIGLEIGKEINAEHMELMESQMNRLIAQVADARSDCDTITETARQNHQALHGLRRMLRLEPYTSAEEVAKAAAQNLEQMHKANQVVMALFSKAKVATFASEFQTLINEAREVMRSVVPQYFEPTKANTNQDTHE